MVHRFKGDGSQRSWCGVLAPPDWRRPNSLEILLSECVTCEQRWREAGKP